MFLLLLCVCVCCVCRRDTLDHAVENVGEKAIHSLVFEFNRHEEDVSTLFSGGSLLWSLQQFQPSQPHGAQHHLPAETSGSSTSETNEAARPNSMPVDNDRIRVLELTLEPDQGSLPMRVGRRVHGGALLQSSLASQGGHAPTLFFALEAWHALISVTAQTQLHVQLEAGQGLWCSSGLRAFENVGQKRTRIIAVALKPQPTQQQQQSAIKAKL